MREYVCLDYVKGQAKIIELQQIMNDNANRLFDKKVSPKALEKEKRYLEKMLYCRHCVYRNDCLMYQTRNDKRGK